MNWESGIFCKLYKTKEYKFNAPKYFNLSEKARTSLISNIKNQIKELQLDNPDIFGFTLNINISENCALYNLSPDNKNYYFSYLINFNFYLYYNLYIYGIKILNFNDKEKNLILNWEIYLVHLLFLREIKTDLLKKEITTNLNNHFKFYCFILKQASFLDIILLSIIIDTALYDEIINKTDDENYQYFRRWVLSMKNLYEIHIDNKKSFYKNKEKDFLYNTYKLTSCQELVEAVKSQNYVKVENLLLLEHKNVESRTDRYYKSLAHLACMKSDKKMLQLLMKYGCNINSLDFENMTPLYDAIYSNNIEFVDYLIKDLKMDINHHEIQNRTPFYWACCTSNIEMIKYLIKYPEIDINSLSSMGRSALSKACWNGHIEVAKLLCSQPDINTINTPDCNKRCPLHNAVWGEFGGREGKKVPIGQPSDSPECTELLIKYGANINAKDIDGNTPLMIAGSTNGIRSMKVLLKYNINTNEENNNHETALIQSIKYGNYESIITLIDYFKNHLSDIKNNIDLEKGDNNGLTPINYAIIYRKVLCLKLMIENMKELGYNCKEKIIELIFLTIKSHSKLCFNFLFNKLVKEFKPTDDEYINIFRDIFIYENISFFNFAYDILGENKIIHLINNNINKELLLYILILEIQIYKFYNIEKEMKNLKNNTKILSQEEREDKYTEILKKKMASLTDDEIELFEDDYEIKNHEQSKDESSFEGTLFLNLINSILSKICLLELQNNELNINLIIYLIFFNKQTEFLSLKSLYTKEKNNIKYIDFHKIIVDKDKFYIYIPEKHKLTREKLFSNDEENKNDVWLSTINYINETNLLFIVIEKSNKIYFNELINNNYLTKYLYDIIQSSKKNILHLLFENFDKNKYEKIMEIVGWQANINNEYYKNKFLPMINQIDSGLMTPIDYILNSNNDNALKLIIKNINDLCKKYFGNNNDLFGKLIKYNITKFKIIVKEFEISQNYIKRILDEKIQCKKFIQKFNVYKYNDCKNDKDSKYINTCTYEEEYNISKYYIDKNIIHYTKKIIDLILENKIENEFKIINSNYIHLFVETEEELIETAKEISNEKIIGVDAEFDGDKCGIDGVVCTIQISSMSKTYVIDSLKLHKFIKKYLGNIFEDNNILKIFHGCDNDLLWILSNFEMKTNNIYDTSRAFVVYQEIILNKSFKNGSFPSLYYLVVFFLGVKLNKSYQTSNWKIRPLTDAMYQYALNDAKSVLYLFYIFQGLYLYLNKICFNENEKYQDFYYELKKLFFKDRESLSLVDTEYPDGYYKNILSKIRLLCLEMIANKLKIKNNKIYIEIYEDE